MKTHEDWMDLKQVMYRYTCKTTVKISLFSSKIHRPFCDGLLENESVEASTWQTSQRGKERMIKLSALERHATNGKVPSPGKAHIHRWRFARVSEPFIFYRRIIHEFMITISVIRPFALYFVDTRTDNFVEIITNGASELHTKHVECIIFQTNESPSIKSNIIFYKCSAFSLQSSNVVASIIITVISLCKWMNLSCFHLICLVCIVSMDATSQLNFNYPTLILNTKRTARTNWCPYFDHLHVFSSILRLSCWQMKYKLLRGDSLLASP